MKEDLLPDLTIAAGIAAKMAEPAFSKPEQWEFAVPIKLDGIVHGIRHLNPIKEGTSLTRLAVEVGSDPTQLKLLQRLKLTERIFSDFLMGEVNVADLRVGVCQSWKYNGDAEGLAWTIDTRYLMSLEGSRLSNARKGTWTLVYSAIAENTISQSVIAVVLLEHLLGSGKAKSARASSGTVDVILQQAAARLEERSNESQVKVQ